MAILELKGVTKAFGGLTAVSNVSLVLEQGTVLSLVGPNGAGKTTLFNLISGFLKVTSGKIFLKGEDVTGVAPFRICKKGLCRTFQLVKPFGDMTVLENIVIGSLLNTKDLRKASEEAFQVMEEIGLIEKHAQLGKNLTIADQKRLELGKALSTKPFLLLLDEVMSGLTRNETDDLINLLRRLAEGGITLLLIEHVMHAVMSLSDRVAILHHGEKIVEGPPTVVVNDPRVIRAYLGDEYAAP